MGTDEDWGGDVGFCLFWLNGTLRLGGEEKEDPSATAADLSEWLTDMN